MWREICTEDPAYEAEILQGGEVATTIQPRMYHDIQVILSRLVAKAEQLVENVTTNLAESWMHVRAKFDGGKVVNRSQSGSWEHRCMGAGLQHNMGKEWGPTIWKEMTSTTPNKVFSDTAQRAAKKASSEKERKAKEEVRKQRRIRKYSPKNDSVQARKAYSRHDDGHLPEEVSSDVTEGHLEALKKSFYETQVVVTDEEAVFIAQQTKEQVDSEVWFAERRKRLTAPTVGSIAKMRATTKRAKRVESLLYSKFRGNTATHYGQAMEDRAKLRYQTYQRQHGHPGLIVESCGLHVSVDKPWLAASPDGLVTDSSDPTHPLGLVEIKNPFVARNLTLMEASKKSSFCLKMNKDSGLLTLPTGHNYYYQIQTQLFCTGRQWCDFALATNQQIHIERIYSDSAWQTANLCKLQNFYFSALLPELACPRHHCGGIREP